MIKIDSILSKILTLIWNSGIGEADFCDAIEINRTAVTDWKKGKTKSYMRHLEKIAAHFDVTVDFLSEDSTKNPPAQNAEGDVELYPGQHELHEIIKNLPPELRDDLLQYGQYLVSTQKK